MLSTSMLISITIVVIILILLAIRVCLLCFRKPVRPQSKYISHRSAASGDHILDNTDVGRPNLSDSVSIQVPSSPKRSPIEPIFELPFGDESILRRKIANNLIAKADRLSEPIPSKQRILSRFLAQHDNHVHAGVVLCNQTDGGTAETNIRVFDKALSPCTVKRITELFEESELKERLRQRQKPNFINIPTESETDLLRKLQNSCLNRKLSMTQRLSENSGLRLPLDIVAASCLNCREHSKESGYTIYGDASVFQFIDTIPNEMLTPELIKEIQG